MIIKHEIKTDLTNTYEMVQVHVVQGDSCTRVLVLTLEENGALWTVPENLNVAVRYRKPDGTGGIYDTLPDGTEAWYQENGELNIVLAPQMMTVPGCTMAQVQLMCDGKICSTFAFQVLVEEDLSVGTLESADYFNWSQWASQELDRLLAQASENSAFDGATFTPHISEDGILSWTNDQEKENPDPIDITELLGKVEGESLLKLSGGTMRGKLDMDGNTLTGIGEPVSQTDAISKEYADGAYAPGGYGLGAAGELKLWTDIDAIVENGWYTLNDVNATLNNIAVGYAYLHVCGYDINWVTQRLYPLQGEETTVLRRVKAGGSWNEWEAENPPMALGVEYRTTERWEGKPVYTMAVDCGNLPDTAGVVSIYPFTAVSVVELSAWAVYEDGTMFTLTSHPHAYASAVQNGIVLSASIDGMGGYHVYARVKYTKA